jgi:hypothetical protein
MEPLEKCMSVLRVVIGQASNANSIVLAENALDTYLASFSTGMMKTGALTILQETLKPHWRAAAGVQLDFINLIYDYTDKQMRELQEP